MGIRRAILPAALALGLAGSALTSAAAATAATHVRTDAARVTVIPRMHYHGHVTAVPLMHYHGHVTPSPLMHYHG
jgi:hypothetical protein